MLITNQNKASSKKKKKGGKCLGFCQGLLSSVLKRVSDSAPDLQWVKYYILKTALVEGMVCELSYKENKGGLLTESKVLKNRSYGQAFNFHSCTRFSQFIVVFIFFSWSIFKALILKVCF